MPAEGLTFPLVSSQKIIPLWLPGSEGPSLPYKNSQASEDLNVSTMQAKCLHNASQGFCPRGSWPREGGEERRGGTWLQ